MRGRFYCDVGGSGAVSRDLLDPDLYYADDLITHLVDVGFLREVAGQYIDSVPESADVTGVVAPAVSGIPFGTILADELGVPLVVARKSFGIATRGEIKTADVKSYTGGVTQQLGISARQLDRLGPSVLLADDFLATGAALSAVHSVLAEHGHPVGAAVILAKPELGGVEALVAQKCPVWTFAELPCGQPDPETVGEWW